VNDLVHQDDIEKNLAALGGFDALAASVEASDDAVEQELFTEAGGGVEYVTFKRHGEQGDLSPWEFGLEGQQIHPDSEWVVDFTTFQHGWYGYEGSYEGKKSKGRKPTKVMAPFNQKFPPIPDDAPWANKKAWQFRAICRASPIEEHVGVMVENCDYRRMKTGYAELERACRMRIRQAQTAKAAGDMETFRSLAGAMHPVIRFRFELGVDTGGNGLHNRGIIEHVGWTSGIIQTEQSTETESAEDLGEAIEAKAVTRRRRRD